MSNDNDSTQQSGINFAPRPARGATAVSFADLSDGRLVELIDPRPGDGLQLLLFDGSTYAVAKELETEDLVLSAPELSGATAATVFPAFPVDCGSPESLFEAVRNVLIECGIPADIAHAAAHFIFASWFAHELPSIPRLAFTASLEEARLFMKLLGRLVRRALYVGSVDLHLMEVARYLEPTVLLDARGLTNSSWRLLSLNGGPAPAIFRRNSIISLNAAMVLYLGPDVPEDAPLEGIWLLHLPPLNGPIAADEAVQKLTAKLQGRLLDYRVRNYHRVGAWECDMPGVDLGTRALVQMLGGCYPDSETLRRSVLDVVTNRLNDLRLERFTNLPCILLELLLVASHEGKELLAIGELTHQAQALLKGRGVGKKVMPQEVGAELRKFGLVPIRRNAGYRLLLSDPVPRKVHELAMQHEVEVAGGLMSADCKWCNQVFEGAQSVHPVEDENLGEPQI